MGERQKPKKNGREEKANSKKNHRIGDFDSSCSGTAFCLFLSQEHGYEKNDIPEGRDGCMGAVRYRRSCKTGSTAGA